MDAKTILYDIVYVVTMKRWGADSSHHYIVGIYRNLDHAKQVAQEEKDCRGGKYEWVIQSYSLNGKEVPKEMWSKSSSVKFLESIENISHKEFVKRYEQKQDAQLKNDIEEIELEIESLQKTLEALNDRK